MASKAIATAAFLLSLNLMFFTLVSSCGTCSTPVPIPKIPPKNNKPSPSPPSRPASCPRDALKLKVCANVLNLINISLPPTDNCCHLIDGLVDLEAALCLCTAIKANILGINLNIPVSLSLILNHCGKNVPKDFQCRN